MKRLYRIKYIDKDRFMNESLLESEDIMNIIEYMILIKKIRLEDIYSISRLESEELIDIKLKNERFKRFRRIIEDYIYNDIDLEEFDYSDYIRFLDRFYDFSNKNEEYYLFEEFREYLDNLNYEFHKILDL